jgi:hypothetical protein
MILTWSLLAYLGGGIYTLLLYFPNRDYFIAQASVAKPLLADWSYHALVCMFCFQVILQWPVWARAFYYDDWL